ncbi:MAG TPA: hypothetical protein VGR81_10090 [Candidatus Acidoferrales bacterium]|nr:hypothetical protein [Candidatus Acidoferrales bacterium]
MNAIDELREAIKRLHGVESRHIESVPVKEMFQGKTVWEGIVEVFELVGHEKASRLYAWIQDVDGKKRHFTVLHVAPVDSPLAAVRAAILHDYRNAQEA